MDTTAVGTWEGSCVTVQALLCQMSPGVRGHATGEGGHPLVDPSLSSTLNLCFRVETLEHILPFPITLCTTWHNKALCGGSPGAAVALCMHPICSGGITGELILLVSACRFAA